MVFDLANTELYNNADYYLELISGLQGVIIYSGEQKYYDIANTSIRTFKRLFWIE